MPPDLPVLAWPAGGAGAWLRLQPPESAAELTTTRQGKSLAWQRHVTSDGPEAVAGAGRQSRSVLYDDAFARKHSGYTKDMW